jgi:hypothetical protein
MRDVHEGGQDRRLFARAVLAGIWYYMQNFLKEDLPEIYTSIIFRRLQNITTSNNPSHKCGIEGM